MTRVELNMVKPQQQLDSEIYKWVYEKDSPDTLLIVYYGGHGIYDKKTNALEIAPYVIPNTSHITDLYLNNPSQRLLRSPPSHLVQIRKALHRDCKIRHLHDHGLLLRLRHNAQPAHPRPHI